MVSLLSRHEILTIISKVEILIHDIFILSNWNLEDLGSAIRVEITFKSVRNSHSENIMILLLRSSSKISCIDLEPRFMKFSNEFFELLLVKLNEYYNLSAYISKRLSFVVS